MIIASVGVEVEVKQVRALGCYQIMFMIPDVRENIICNEFFGRCKVRNGIRSF